MLTLDVYSLSNTKYRIYHDVQSGAMKVALCFKMVLTLYLRLIIRG